jgi:hypothetical protein
MNCGCPVGLLLLQLAVDEVIAEQKRFAARIAEWTRIHGKPPFSIDVDGQGSAAASVKANSSSTVG